jgi:hypothetical protein
MKTFLFGLAWGILATTAFAQISTINTTATGSGSSGTGAKLLWYPAKAAFIAQAVNGTEGNDANVGYGSAVFGSGNTAGGPYNYYSYSMGYQNDNTGQYSLAIGYGNIVNGGSALASGWNNYIFGPGAAIGVCNTVGSDSSAFAFGASNMAWGDFSVAIGSSNTAGSDVYYYPNTVAIGQSNTSLGWGSVTIGRSLKSYTSGCVVVGISNVDTPTSDGYYWRGADPVFIVGNGTGGSAAPGETGPVQGNALVIYKNGDIKIPKRQGDISMGEFAP